MDKEKVVASLNNARAQINALDTTHGADVCKLARYLQQIKAASSGISNPSLPGSLRARLITELENTALHILASLTEAYNVDADKVVAVSDEILSIIEAAAECAALAQDPAPQRKDLH